jgi:outer membrane lipoprotein-sorting protein
VRIRKGASIILAIIVGGVALPRPSPAASAQVVVAPILERMAYAFQGMRSLRAALSQQKTYGQLGITDPVEQGVLYIKRKSEKNIQVRIEIKQPAQRVITVKDDQFTVFQPKINQAIEGSVNKSLGSNSSAAGFLSYFFGGLSQATRDYTVATVEDEVLNGRRATHLRLTPQALRKGLYRQIDLWVDNSLWVPIQQRVVEANQDITQVQLMDIQINVNLPDTLFIQKLPRDVQRVRS